MIIRYSLNFSEFQCFFYIFLSIWESDLPPRGISSSKIAVDDVKNFAEIKLLLTHFVYLFKKNHRSCFYTKRFGIPSSGMNDINSQSDITHHEAIKDEENIGEMDCVHDSKYSEHNSHIFIIERSDLDLKSESELCKAGQQMIQYKVDQMEHDSFSFDDVSALSDEQPYVVVDSDRDAYYFSSDQNLTQSKDGTDPCQKQLTLSNSSNSFITVDLEKDREERSKKDDGVHESKMNERSRPLSVIMEECDYNHDIETQIASPKIRRNQLLPLESPSANQKRKKRGIFPLEKTSKENLSCRNFIPSILGILALATSFISRQSVDFVKLKIPVSFDEHYRQINYFGIYYFTGCRVEELVSIEMQSHSAIITKLIYDNDGLFDEKPIDETIILIPKETFETVNSNRSINMDPKSYDKALDISEDDNDVICQKISISLFDVTDSFWNISRLLVGISQWLGCLSVALLLAISTSSSFPMTMIYCLIFTCYVLQGSAFFFYDSDLCKLHGCYFSSGTYYAIVSVICWFLSGLGLLFMNEMRKRKEEKREVSVSKQNKAAMLIHSGFQRKQKSHQEINEI